MKPKSAIEIEGFEHDWLASDAEGYVALFSTAGGGYAPEEFLRDTDAHDSAINAILAAPTTTIALFGPELPEGVQNTWRMAAEHGLFAFDSDPQGGPYKLVSAPAAPVKAIDLIGSAGVDVVFVPLVQLRFANLSLITKKALK